MAERFNDWVRDESDLTEMETRIARRADEIARARGMASDWDADWECWLEAEREVLRIVDEPVLT